MSINEMRIDENEAKAIVKLMSDDEKQVLHSALSRSLVNRRFHPGMGETSDRHGVDKAAGYEHFGEFLASIKSIKNGGVDARLKALSEGVDSSGGFTVPEQFRGELFANVLETSIVRPRATVIPMASDTLVYPALDDNSHVSNRFGGVISYWVQEAGNLTPTDPAFRQLKFIAKKLTGYTRTSDELIADNAVALGNALTRIFSEEIRWQEDYAFLQGDGVGKPLGIFRSGALLRVNRAAASQVSLADLANIVARMYPGSLNSASTIWIFSPAVFAQLIPLVATVITWTAGGGGAAQAIPRNILGYPYAVSEKVPTLGTSGDIGLYDLSYYAIGDRQDLRVDTSDHLYFQSDETAWRFIERVDGQPLIDSAFTPANSGSTLSPFVQLYSATTGGD